jgi:hypothetical protein
LRDKCPGIRPIGIGVTWRRAIAKCILHVWGSKEAQELTSFVGLESGIEGAIHAMTHVGDQAEEEWGFLLIDAKNVQRTEPNSPCCGQVRLAATSTGLHS